MQTKPLILGSLLTMLLLAAGACRDPELPPGVTEEDVEKLNKQLMRGMLEATAHGPEDAASLEKQRRRIDEQERRIDQLEARLAAWERRSASSTIAWSRRTKEDPEERLRELAERAQRVAEDQLRRTLDRMERSDEHVKSRH